mgnify:FL=1
MKYLFFIISLVISNLSYSYENNQLLLQNPAKKINFFDLETLDGSEIKVADKFIKKKLILINFWATWCPPCIKEIPDLIKLGKKFENEIEVIFVSVDANPKKVIPNFLKQNNLEDFQTFIDKKLILTKELGVKVMPTTLIIDGGPYELSRVEGYIDWLNEEILKELKNLL